MSGDREYRGWGIDTSPPPALPGVEATAAVGMHPTGMLSCYYPAAVGMHLTGMLSCYYFLDSQHSLWRPKILYINCLLKTGSTF